MQTSFGDLPKARPFRSPERRFARRRSRSDEGMHVLTVSHLSKRFGDLKVLDSISFSINAGDRIGLIGPNGSGKSTLLDILTNNLQADSGAVKLSPHARIGYLRQGFADLAHGTLSDLLDIPTHGLLTAQANLDQATADLARYEHDPSGKVTAYDRALADFESAGDYPAIDELETLLNRFGLSGKSLARPLGTLSGGEKTRAGLAALLASRPDLLLLDEPTNHLDIEALSWLGSFLRSYQGGILIVSHDRGFLDEVVTAIFALDPDRHRLTSYAGSYSDYVRAKRQEAEAQASAYHRQQKDIARITDDIRGAEHHARTIEANSIDFAVRKKAARIARPAVVRKRKLEKLLDSASYVEKPEQRWGMAIDLNATSKGARQVAILDNVSVSFGSRCVLHDVSLHISHGEHIAIVGPNGHGKSTLVRLLANDLSPSQGSVSIGPGVKIGYFAQEQGTLELDSTVLEHARAVANRSESDLRTFLHRFLFGGGMVHRLVGDLSYGERARLMLSLLVLQGTTLLLLDEPLNHLDIDARERFEQALEQFEGTTVMVLHDRYAVRRLANRVIEVKGGTINELVQGLALERTT